MIKQIYFFNYKFNGNESLLLAKKKLNTSLVLLNRWDTYYYNYIIRNKRRHLYHIVDESPWPLCMSLSILFMLVGFVMYLHLYTWGGFLFTFSFLMVVYTSILWFRDIIREATYLGHHTTVVRSMLRFGMLLFIVSEVMFFFGFFWAFFHSSLAPTIYIGGIWPPLGINAPAAKGIPLINTVTLLCSGLTITLAQIGVKLNNRKIAFYGFSLTLIYAIYFIGWQVFEYFHLGFNITDGVFGSTFFMLTGLHGMHVIAGMLFILVCFVRFYLCHYNTKHHLSLTFAAWYWHFVDVVWLFLFVFVYCWGGWLPSIFEFGYIMDIQSLFFKDFLFSHFSDISVYN